MINLTKTNVAIVVLCKIGIHILVNWFYIWLILITLRPPKNTIRLSLSSLLKQWINSLVLQTFCISIWISWLKISYDIWSYEALVVLPSIWVSSRMSWIWSHKWMQFLKKMVPIFACVHLMERLSYNFTVLTNRTCSSSNICWLRLNLHCYFSLRVRQLWVEVQNVRLIEMLMHVDNTSWLFNSTSQNLIWQFNRRIIRNYPQLLLSLINVIVSCSADYLSWSLSRWNHFLFFWLCHLKVLVLNRTLRFLCNLFWHYYSPYYSRHFLLFLK